MFQKTSWLAQIGQNVLGLNRVLTIGKDETDVFGQGVEIDGFERKA